MLFAKANALAAVYVHDGEPRDLARSRRDLKLSAGPVDVNAPRTDHRIQALYPEWFAVGDDAIEFWSTDPQRSRSRKDRFVELHRARMAT